MCGMSDAARERYLGIIEARCTTRQTGASWQRHVVSMFEKHGLDRQAALHNMLARYIEHMHTGAPVHTWPLD